VLRSVKLRLKALSSVADVSSVQLQCKVLSTQRTYGNGATPKPMDIRNTPSHIYSTGIWTCCSIHLEHFRTTRILTPAHTLSTFTWHLKHFCFTFYAPQQYRQVLLRRVLAMAILSVCLSVTSRYPTKPRWDRDSGSSPYGSLEYLVSYEVIWCQWVTRVPSNEGIKEGYPP